MDEYRVEVGTIERAFEVSHLRIKRAALEASPFIRVLESAAHGFHLRASRFQLSLADSYERSSCLWIVGEFLPVRAPGTDDGIISRATSFRNFRGNASFVGGKEVVAFLDTDLVASAGTRVGGTRGRTGWSSRVCGSGRRVAIRVGLGTGEH